MIVFEGSLVVDLSVDGCSGINVISMAEKRNLILMLSAVQYILSCNLYHSKMLSMKVPF